MYSSPTLFIPHCALFHDWLSKATIDGCRTKQEHDRKPGIDEIGKGKATAWPQGRDRRYRHNKTKQEYDRNRDHKIDEKRLRREDTARRRDKYQTKHEYDRNTDHKIEIAKRRHSQEER
jgi:hypothetical protein